jgi:hypothetical protein
MMPRTEKCDLAHESKNAEARGHANTTVGDMSSDAGERTDAARMLAIFAADRANRHSAEMLPPDEHGKVRPKKVHSWCSRPTIALMQQHLDGKIGLGCWPRCEDGTCTWIPLDFDEYQVSTVEMRQRAAAIGVPVLICQTKSGGTRVILLLRRAAPAELCQKAMENIARRIGVALSQGHNEVIFNNVWLPYMGGNESTCCALGKAANELSVKSFLREAEAARISPEKFEELLVERDDEADRRAGANYAEQRLERYSNEIPRLTDGRDRAIWGAAVNMASMIEPGWIDRTLVWKTLLRAGLGAGMAQGDVEDKLRRGLSKTGRTPPRDAAALRSLPKLADLVKDAADLRTREFEPLRYVVPVYLVEGLTLLIGKPKFGKSWWSLDVCIAVATGGKCMDQSCEEGDVLYLALEDSDRRMKRRMETMLEGKAWPKRLRYATQWPHLDEGGLDLIRQWIAEAKSPRLIVVDVLARVRQRSRGRESVYMADYEALLKLHDLASEFGVAVVVVHHQRKMTADDRFDTVSGTHGLTGAADATLILDRQDNVKILTGKGRDLEEFSVAVRQCTTMRWVVVGDEAEVRLSEERRSIIDVLRSARGRGMKLREIAREAGQTYECAKVRLSSMAENGEVERISRGVYRLPPAQHELTLVQAEEAGL